MTNGDNDDDVDDKEEEKEEEEEEHDDDDDVVVVVVAERTPRGFAARSRVLARLVSLAQIGELARRLLTTLQFC